MQMTLAILGSAGLLSLLIVLIAALSRRFFWVRQLAFPLSVAAAVATVEVFTLLQPGYRPRVMGRVLAWTLLFLGLVTAFRLVGLYLF
ncbi:MAG: hypothetical protein ACLGI9_13130, partial [Thermoanaerobaculia bacterium]